MLFAFVAFVAALTGARGSDWLITPPSAFPFPTFSENADGTFTLTNGLISRTFMFGAGGFGTVDMRDEVSGTSLLRAIESEGYISLSGENFTLGSIIQTGTYYHAYLNRSATGIAFNADAFTAVSYALGSPTAPFPWTPGTRGSPATSEWPPRGLQVAFSLSAPASAPASVRAVAVTLVYEMYPGIPLLTKWVSVASNGTAAAGVTVDAIITESQRLAGPYTSCSLGSQSPVTSTWVAPASLLYVATDQAHGTLINFPQDSASVADPGAVECVLQATYETGPGVVLQGGAAPPHMLHRTLVGAGVAEFVSFRTFELVLDSRDAERTALATKRLFRLWAPHAQENPIFFHAVDSTVAGFQSEVDQLAATGFEMIIFSFGSAFNLETDDPKYIAQVKSQIDYAKSKGVETGGEDAESRSPRRRANVRGPTVTPRPPTPFRFLLRAHRLRPHLPRPRPRGVRRGCRSAVGRRRRGRLTQGRRVLCVRVGRQIERLRVRFY